jgi:phosphoribosylglycinamide formyltransferase-1
VTPETDAGPILMQGAVAVSDHDTAQTLAERVLEVEHRIYPDALRLLARGQVRLDGDICRTTAGAGAGNFLISPIAG